MPEVFLSGAARSDLTDIRLYSLEQFGPKVADTYFLGFDDAFDMLSEHPQAGPARPDIGVGIRCLVHRQHRLFYRVEAERVVILRVIHHAMDIGRKLPGN